jgi:hypothetical protein
MVVLEALLVDCGAGEGDVSSLIEQVLSVFECLLGVFLNVCRDACGAVADVRG